MKMLYLCRQTNIQCISMIKSTYIFFVFFMLTAVWSCNRPSDMQREHPAVSPTFYADSLCTLGRGIRLIKEEKERLAFPPLDSVFRLPVDDVLTTEELRRLSSESLRRLMIYFNLMMNFESGYQYFDSLERAKHPVVSRYCRRELWVVKAQMLMALDRHAEAVDYLNRAMALKDENNDPLSEIFCTATAGITYMGVDTISTRAESAFRRACRVAERSGLSNYWLYPQAIGRLADIYLQQGKYEESISLCREAIRLCEKSGSYHGKLVVAEILTEAYRLLGLYDEAFRYCAVGTGEPARAEVDNNLIGRFFIAKAEIHNNLNRPDSALLVLAQADSCFDRTKNDYYHLMVQIDRMYYLAAFPDSVNVALRGFAALEGKVPRHRLPYYDYYYGATLARVGKWLEAIPLLRKSIGELKDISELHPASEAAELLMEGYRHTGRAADILTVFPEYRVMRDSVTRKDKIRQLASANIRFETQKKEQENLLLTAEVRLQDTLLHVYSIAGVCTLLLVFFIAGWMVMRHRNLRLRWQLEAQEHERADERLRDQESRLHELIAARQDLYERNRSLIRQLSDIQARHRNTCELDSVMESLQSHLLTRKEEEDFRNAFLSVYPSALLHLREACPAVTRSEELFCMLVLLKQSNEELARTLGISVASVSKTRYRIRVKLGLPEGSDTDAEIRHIMAGEDL